jgi:hypothetical protein
VSFRIDSPPVRNAETGEVDTALVGQPVQIVLRDTTTPYPILNGAEDSIPDSLLTVTTAHTLPTFRIAEDNPVNLFLDWYQPSSGKRGPVIFDKVMRDVALAALEQMGDLADEVRALIEAGVIGGGGGGGTVASWSTLLGKPDTFPPSGHTHSPSEISGLSAAVRQALAAADAQAFRTAIGAGTGNGTSNLTLGTTSTTAAPGNHTHAQYVDQAQAASIADARIAASGGGGGGGTTLDWEYRSGAYPALPATKPAGVLRVHAYGPVAPSSVPSWIGPAVNQARLSYDYDPTLS